MTSKKSAYFYKTFVFNFPGLLTESQLNELNQFMETKANDICAVNEKFHPYDVFADVFERLTCKTELINGKLIFNLTAKHKNSSIKFDEEKIKTIITTAVPGSAFAEAVSRKRAIAEKKTITTKPESLTPIASEPLSPLSTGSIYMDKPEIEIKQTATQLPALKLTSNPSSNNAPHRNDELDDDDDNVSIASDIYNEEYKLWKLSQQRARQPVAEKSKNKTVSDKAPTSEPEPEKSDSLSISLNKETVISFFLGFLSGSVVNGK
jgi:hypothetical protein